MTSFFCFSPKPEKRNTRKSRSPKPPRRPGVPIKDGESLCGVYRGNYEVVITGNNIFASSQFNFATKEPNSKRI